MAELTGCIAECGCNVEDSRIVVLGGYAGIMVLLSGEPATRATVARLAHGGLLTRDQRFRFPAYALALDAPDG